VPPVGFELSEKSNALLQLVKLLRQQPSYIEGGHRAGAELPCGGQAGSATLLGSTPLTTDFSELVEDHKLLLQHFDSSTSMITTDWTLVKSKLAPLERAVLLNIEGDLTHLLWQQDALKVQKQPSLVLEREDHDLSSFFQLALAQVKPDFVNKQVPKIHIDAILAAYNLRPNDPKVFDLKAVLCNNYQFGTQCCPLQIPAVKEFLWLALAFLSPSFANDFCVALLDSKETTATFFAHLEMHKSGGRKACFIQGLIGAGKIF
jgi:hypothetical protein